MSGSGRHKVTITLVFHTILLTLLCILTLVTWSDGLTPPGGANGDNVKPGVDNKIEMEDEHSIEEEDIDDTIVNNGPMHSRVQRSVISGDTREWKSEKVLVRHLLDDYKKRGTIGRPVKNFSEETVVEVALHLVQILDLDENNQILMTSLKTVFNWTDDFLVWDPEQYDGLSVIGLPPQGIWTPDIILSNSVAEEENIDSNSFVRVNHMGNVSWIQRKVYRTSCQIDMGNYPFDSQKCDMRVKSAFYQYGEIDIKSTYVEDKNLLDIELDKHHILLEYIPASEWDVVGVKMFEDFKDYTPHDTMRYQIILRRKVVFFTYILMLPCVFLTMLTMVIFWLPPERPDKTTLAMSIFGSFTVLLLVLTGSIPSTASSIPILGIYYFFNMVITAISIALATIVVNVARSSKSKPRVPKWLKSVAIDTLGGIFGVNPGRMSKVQERLRHKKLQRDAARRQELRKHQMPETGDSIQRPVSIISNSTPAVLPDELRKFEELISKTENILDSPKCEGEAGCNTRMETLVTEMRDTLRLLTQHTLHRDKSHDFRDEKAAEWHTVAVAIDRMFFFFYLAIMIVLGIVSAAILFPRVL